MSRKNLIAAAVALAALFPAAARATDLVFYNGAHPLATRFGQGMCFVNGPHVHSYRPHKRVLYVKSGKHWVFVGDPVEFEPKEPKHLYYGHHPVFWVTVTGPVPYCYIQGPHHHWHVPPGHLKYAKKGGAWWFVGGHPSHYRPKSWRVRALHEHYVEVGVSRPVITVTPPAGFVGVYVGPGGFQTGLKVHAPGFKIKGPGVKIKIKGPGLTIKAKGPAFGIWGGFGVSAGKHRHPRGRVKHKHRGHKFRPFGKGKRK